MPFAVTHVLVPIIILELCRDNFKKCSKLFSRRHVFLVGIAGLLPDVSLLISRVVELLGKSVPLTDLGHRVIFHNLWIPLGFLLFYFILKYLGSTSRKKKRKKLLSFSKVFLVLFIGFMIHLMLDVVLTGYIMPFYPMSDYLINWNLIGQIATVTGIPQLTILVSMDALLLLFWLWHEEMEHNIKDYF
jgi:membrane-bound metal-dependent hydrolase YbcI (DUF457 family)